MGVSCARAGANASHALRAAKLHRHVVSGQRITPREPPRPLSTSFTLLQRPSSRLSSRACGTLGPRGAPARTLECVGYFDTGGRRAPIWALQHPRDHWTVTAWAALTTCTASQLREPRQTRCPTAAASGRLGTSVAYLTVTATVGKEARPRDYPIRKRRSGMLSGRLVGYCALDQIIITRRDSPHTSKRPTPRESGVFFAWAPRISVKTTRGNRPAAP